MSPAARLLSVPVYLWRWLLSPVFPSACRYAPSCSAYALDALRSHGAVRGAWIAFHRLCRCHPWGGSGFDPVPPAAAPTAPAAEARCSPFRHPSR